MNFNEFLVRVAFGSIVTALFCAGAVFFVVDISLRGLETAHMETARRVGDVNDSIVRLDEASVRRIGDLRSEILRESEALGESIESGFDRIEMRLTGIEERAALDTRDQAAELARRVAMDEAVRASAEMMLDMFMVLVFETVPEELSAEQAAQRTALMRQRDRLCATLAVGRHPACTM